MTRRKAHIFLRRHKDVRGQAFLSQRKEDIINSNGAQQQKDRDCSISRGEGKQGRAWAKTKTARYVGDVLEGSSLPSCNPSTEKGKRTRPAIFCGRRLYPTDPIDTRCRDRGRPAICVARVANDEQRGLVWLDSGGGRPHQPLLQPRQTGWTGRGASHADPWTRLQQYPGLGSALLARQHCCSSRRTRPWCLQIDTTRLKRRVTHHITVVCGTDVVKHKIYFLTMVEYSKKDSFVEPCTSHEAPNW